MGRHKAVRKIFDINPRLPKNLNLYKKRILRVPFYFLLKTFALVLILIISLGEALAPPKSLSPHAEAEEQNPPKGEEENNNLESAAPTPEAERQELENQLEGLEKQIEEHQKTIEEYQRTGKTLKNEIGSLNTKINKLNLQIKAVSLNLAELNQSITDTQKQINRTENKVDYHKDAISRSLRALDEADNQSVFETLMLHSRLSDFFNSINNITLVQNNLRVALIEIVKLRQELLEQKEELSIKKEDTENLKGIQESQKKSVEATQSQKANLLTITKGKEAEYQKILKKTQETAAQIRTRIFEFLGGGELTFEKAYDYARLAEGATGVRASLILAVLSRESLLGKNVGRCQYNQTISWTSKPAMNPKDVPVFLALLSKLNIDPASTIAKISCPNRDGTYGGAMGPAQFIPSTWVLYESDISKITGNNPPNPWNNSDAFVATALYLKRFGADAKTVSSERRAAAIYYCGTRWQRLACSVYAGRVIDTANKFQKDIEILNS